ncbi:sulfite exporter TauE/SafE family protein [Patescibacteria group bacterium]|nr:sulfite exporter TauE/SafE family protein [Patescibacteria group bacterium]
MNYFLLPIAGLLVGALGGTAGVGGAILLVPILLWLGFSKNLAVGTSFVNVLVVAITALALYGSKGSIDWKAGAFLAAGTVLGVWLATTFVQPHLDEKTFRYFFAAVLIVMAVFVLLKK